MSAIGVKRTLRPSYSPWTRRGGSRPTWRSCRSYCARLALDELRCHQRGRANLLSPPVQKSPLLIKGHFPGSALCFALRNAISHCSRVYSSARRKTASATLKLLCITQRKPVTSPVPGSCCARVLQIGQWRTIGPSLARHYLISLSPPTREQTQTSPAGFRPKSR